jgi:hypothetical protein
MARPRDRLGLVLPDNDSVSAADKALGKDAKEPFQRLFAARAAPPCCATGSTGSGFHCDDIMPTARLLTSR